MHVRTNNNRILYGLSAGMLALLFGLLGWWTLSAVEDPGMVGNPDDVVATVHNSTAANSDEPSHSTTTATSSEETSTGTTATTSPQEVEVGENEELYIHVVDSCDHNFQGDDCVNVRSGPGTEYPVVDRLRNDIVLLVDEIIEESERTWYKILFDEELRYPERLEGEWYVASDFVRPLASEGVRTSWEHGAASTSKRIVVDRTEQRLYAYDGDELFMQSVISTGEELTPTPSGSFTVFKKTPTRYMQGPLPNLPVSDDYDLPGVPWNLYFTERGAVIHGAYWHDNFGNRHSHGCVNLLPEEAKILYEWAELGTEVIVQG